MSEEETKNEEMSRTDMGGFEPPEETTAIPGEGKPGETPTAPEPEATPTEPEKDAPPETAKTEQVPGTPIGVQKRINKAVGKQKVAEAEAEEAKAELAKMKAQAAPVEEAVPQIEDFDEIPAYEAAVKEHFEKRADAREAKGRNEGLEEAKYNEDQRAFQATWDEQVAKAKESGLTDLDTVIGSILDGTVPISDGAVDFIHGLPKAAEVFYQLGKNPEEAKRIANLDENGQKREILRIELGLAGGGPKPQKLTKAPAPIKPVAGGGSGVADLDSMSTKAFMDSRNAGDG